MTKNKIIKIWLGLRRPLYDLNMQQPTKKEAAAMEETTEGRCDEQDTREKCDTIILGAL